MSDAHSRPSRTSDSGSSRTLEIAHVLFTDIVGYSKLPMEEQEQLLLKLQDTVRQTTEFARAQADDQLIRLPTGDGMALVFFGDAEAPVRCALELGRSLRSQAALKLRMGIHTGPVYRVADINANRNVAGGGINIAQRVMDCGDAGHILVSKTVADVLGQVSHWNGSLHELGEVEVKHGIRVHLFNLYTEEAGNPKAPKKLSATKALHKSDSGKTPRVARSGPHHKQRNGIQAPTEGKVQTVSSHPKGVKSTVLQTDRQGRFSASLRKRMGFFGVAVLILGALAFAVPSVRRGIFSAASEKRVSPPGIPPLTEGKYLAVLPFGVDGDQTKLGSIAEGLNQELSAKLLALRDVTVTSARAAEGVDPRGNPVTIARSLGVNLIVHGTVQGDDKAIQITV